MKREGSADMFAAKIGLARETSVTVTKELDLETPRDFLWELHSYAYTSAFQWTQDASRPLFEVGGDGKRDFIDWMQRDNREGPVPREMRPDRFLMLAGEKKVERLGDASGSFGPGFALVTTRWRDLLAEVGQACVEYVPFTVELQNPKARSPVKGGGGARIEDGFWGMHHWQRLDTVDRRRSDADFESVSEFGRRTSNERFGPADYPDIVTAYRRLALTVSNIDVPVFGIKGLPGQRFVSPAFERLLRERKLKVLLRRFYLNQEREWALSAAGYTFKTPTRAYGEADVWGDPKYEDDFRYNLRG
jgi:hypothetical protein